MLISSSQFLIHELTCRAQAFFSTMKELGRKPLSSVLTVLVIGIALGIPAVFWVFLSNVESVSNSWQPGNQISLFLQKSITDADQRQLLDYLRRRDDIAYVNLITPTQGLTQLEQSGGLADLRDLLPNNPLPAVVEVHPALSFKAPDKINILFNHLQRLPEVDMAKLDSEWLKKLHAVEKVASKVTEGFMLLLAVAVLLIISNTIRLSVQNKQQEIEVLKLIGATNRFIRRPFVYSGMIYGVFGAVIALMLVDVALLFVSKPVIKLSHTYHVDYRLQGLQAANGLLLILLGFGLGWFGASLSVRRQIAAIEPQ